MGLGVVIAVDGVPDEVASTASSVEISERMGEATTFRMRYPVDIEEGDLPWLFESRLDPGSELSVLVPLEERVHCLVKGPVNGQQVHMVHGGAGSWMEVNGTDTSMEMDRETRAVIWSDVSDSDAVYSVLSNYGYTPDVAPTDSRHFQNKHALVQRETDLQFVRRLARRNGYLFWVTCDPAGVETAHFKRPVLEGEAAAVVGINLQSPSFDSIDFNWDVERPTQVAGAQLDLNTLTVIDGAVAVSPQSSLGVKNLSAVANGARSVHLAAPADDAGDLQARGNATLSEADWFIRATCEVSFESLGALVRAHTIIELSGAGSRYSGKYFVAGVRHTIDAAEHRMGIELVRNGWE